MLSDNVLHQSSQTGTLRATTSLDVPLHAATGTVTRVIEAAAIVTQELARHDFSVIAAILADLAEMTDSLGSGLYAVFSNYSLFDERNRERNRAAAQLISEWLADDDGYDERVWPVLEPELRDMTIDLWEP